MPFDRSTFTEELDEATTVQEAEPSLVPIYAGLVVLIAMLAVSVATFGLPGLFIPAVAFVPVMFVILIRITMG